MASCLDDSDLVRFHADQLDNARLEEVLVHLAECPRCAQRNSELLADDEKLEDLIHTSDLTEARGAGTTETVARRPDRGPKYAVPEIPGYRIVRELHRGGQGIVYQAVQEGTHRKVAVKVLIAGPLASKRARRRFEREIELVAQLDHPHIVSIFHSGETEQGHQYCVMDYVRGLPLNKHVREHHSTLEEVLDLFAKLCQAINYAHQRGVIHRDLKPSNILVDSHGEPKVLDFGLAKTLTTPVDTLVSVTGQVVGTLPYMSPEQARGSPEDVDTRTDIYSLGVILYELLTGHYPYPVVGNMADVLKNIAETPPTPPSREWDSSSGVTRREHRRLRPGTCPIDDEVQTIVLKTLAKEKERRYQAAGDVARDVEHYLRDEPIEAKRDSGWYVLRKSVHKHRAKVLVSAAFIAVIIVFGFTYRHVRAKGRAAALVETAKREMELAGHAEIAHGLLVQAIELDPKNYKAYGNAANLFLDWHFDGSYNPPDTAQLDAADENLDRALRLNPDHPGLWNIRAVILYELGRLDEAEDACRKALRLDPEYYWAEANLAKILALNGNFSDAIEAAKRGVQIAAEKDEDKYADGIWLVLGTLQLHLGDDDAMTSLETARDIDNADERNFLLLARAHLTHPEHLDYRQGLIEADRAHGRHDQKDPRYERILALAYLRNEAWAEAIWYAKAAIDRGDLASFGHLIAAIAEAKLGHESAAREHLAAARENWPAEFENRNYIVHAKKEVLWFDTTAELESLLVEAESLIPAQQP